MASKKRGSEVEKAAPPVNLEEFGVTGLPVFAGTIREEFLPSLTGPRAFKVYKEMSENDPTIGAILFIFEHLSRQITWDIQPFNETTDALEKADFVKGALFDDMSASWPDTLSEILSMLPYGWAYLEIVYKRREGDTSDPTTRSAFSDGKIGWRKFAPRAQETLHSWVMDENGGIKAMNQQGPPDYKLRTIPIEKALLFRTRSAKNNPEGKSILRNAYRPWYFKKRVEEVEGIGVERDLAGLPVITGPENVNLFDTNPINRAAYEKAKAMVRQIRNDEQMGVVLNFGWKLELLSTNGRRQFDTSKIIDRLDTRIAMSVLADFLMLGSKDVGSYALSADKTKLFTISLGSILDTIAATYNRHAIPRLMRLNGWNASECPKLVHGSAENIDLEKLSAYLKGLTEAGMAIFPTADNRLERHLLEAGGLPTTSDDANMDGVPDDLKPQPKLPAEPAPAEPAPDEPPAKKRRRK